MSSEREVQAASLEVHALALEVPALSLEVRATSSVALELSQQRPYAHEAPVENLLRRPQ